MSTAVLVPEKEVAARTLRISAEAKTLKIIDNASMVQAGSLLTTIKAMRKEVDSIFDPVVSAALHAHREAISAKKRVEQPLVDAESHVKRGMADYQAASDRQRAEDERKLQEMARRLAEDQRILEAERMAAAGMDEEADELLAAPVPVAPIVLASPMPKVDGVSMREVWRFRIVDASKIPDAYKVIDEKRIAAVVRALKSEHGIPGVEAYAEKVIAAKASNE